LVDATGKIIVFVKLKLMICVRLPASARAANKGDNQEKISRRSRAARHHNRGCLLLPKFIVVYNGAGWSAPLE
jgi:hypothetical protein